MSFKKGNYTVVFIGLLLVTLLYGVYSLHKPKILEHFQVEFTDKIKRYTKVHHKTYGEVYVFDEKDYISSHILKGEIWEDHLCKKMAELYQPGTDILDIGANLGLNTLRLHTLKPITGTAHLFEPQADVAVALQYNVRNIPHKIYNLPLSNTNNLFGIQQNEQNIGATKVNDSEKSGFQVGSAPLDSIPIPNPVSLVKMDVEGGEMNVLEGAQQFFKTKKPSLVIEIWQGNKEKIFDKLSSMNYKFVEHLGGDDYVFKPK